MFVIELTLFYVELCHLESESVNKNHQILAKCNKKKINATLAFDFEQHGTREENLGCRFSIVKLNFCQGMK